MSVRIMARVFDCHTLSTTQKFVLLALADHANDYGESIYPSVETLCGKTELSERAVRTALGDLRDMELLRIVRPATNKRPNEYAIDLQQLQARSDPEVQQVHPGGAAGAPQQPARGAVGAPKSSEDLTINKPPAKPARKTSGRVPWEPEIDELMQVFSDASGTKLPRLKNKSDFASAQNLWVKPLLEIKNNCNGHTREIVIATVAEMRRRELTFAFPKQIVTVALSLNAGRKMPSFKAKTVYE